MIGSNEFLAEWVGFTNAPQVGKWKVPGANRYVKLPDFMRDMNAIFRWLVPELQRRGLGYVLSDSCGKPPYHAHVYGGYDSGNETIRSNVSRKRQTEAFCEAIRRLEEDEPNED